MFRYNDPLEAADLRKNMSEETRKASLMNQSLMSQSLSDLRNPPGNRHSGEWPRMFASDSDIKDIAEGVESDGPSSLLANTGVIGPQQIQGSEESVCTIMNQGSSGTSVRVIKGKSVDFRCTICKQLPRKLNRSELYSRP